jgi:hypothetical protein
MLLYGVLQVAEIFKRAELCYSVKMRVVNRYFVNIGEGRENTSRL